MFRAAASHELDVARVFPRLDARLETWPHLAAPIPLGDMIAIAHHAENVQVLEPGQIWRKGNIRQGVFVTAEPAMLRERFLHLIQELQHAPTAMIKCCERVPFSITSRRRSRLKIFGIRSSIAFPSSARSRY